MAARDDLICELKPESGDTTVHNLVAGLETLTGTATLAFGTDGGEYYVDISGGTLSAIIASHAIQSAVDGTGVTLAIRAKMMDYNSGGFDKLIGYSSNTTVENGAFITQFGSNNVRARFKDDMSDVVPTTPVAGNKFTLVARYMTKNASAQDTIDVWVSSSGSTGTTPDQTGSLQNFSNVTPDRINFLTQGTGKIRLYYLALFNVEKSNVDGGGMRNDIVAYMAVASPPEADIAWTEGADTIAVAATASVPGVSIDVSWTESADTIAAAVTALAATGTLTIVDIKNNTGFLRVSETFDAYVYDIDDGELVVSFPAQVATAGGDLEIEDELIVTANPYRVVLVDEDGFAGVGTVTAT